jgi:hypothetical protein
MGTTVMLSGIRSGVASGIHQSAEGLDVGENNTGVWFYGNV